MRVFTAGRGWGSCNDSHLTLHRNTKMFPWFSCSRVDECTFSGRSHNAARRGAHSYPGLYQQRKPMSSSCLVPTYPVQSSCVLKGWFDSLLLLAFAGALLPAFEAAKSCPKLSDPCCKLHSGRDLTPLHQRDFSPSPAPSTFFLRWNKFMSAQQICRALWRCR